VSVRKTINYMAQHERSRLVYIISASISIRSRVSGVVCQHGHYRDRQILKLIDCALAMAWSSERLTWQWAS